jgi:hypothetical protein
MRTHPTAVERLAAACTLSLALGAVLATPAAGGADGVQAARSRLFASAAPAMAVDGERVIVVFTPDSWGCQAADAALASAVGSFAGEHRGVAVFSLIPESRRTERPHAFGQPLPGSILVLGDEAMLREARLAPLPRLEIWTSDGRLLLLKSYRHALEENVREELERTLGFLAAAPAS